MQKEGRIGGGVGEEGRIIEGGDREEEEIIE
jgi:hypothetical protein